jgi:hypothetical protein
LGPLWANLRANAAEIRARVRAAPEGFATAKGCARGAIERRRKGHFAWKAELFAQYAGDCQLRVSRLQTALHRRRDQLLRVRETYALAKQIGVATKSIDRRKRDRVDSVFDHGVTRSWKPGDPVGERADEIP